MKGLETRRKKIKFEIYHRTTDIKNDVHTQYTPKTEYSPFEYNNHNKNILFFFLQTTVAVWIIENAVNALKTLLYNVSMLLLLQTVYVRWTHRNIADVNANMRARDAIAVFFCTFLVCGVISIIWQQNKWKTKNKLKITKLLWFIQLGIKYIIYLTLQWVRITMA